MRFLAVLGFCALLGGCANFKAVSEFAGETTKLTATVKSEFDQMQKLCVKQAELSIVLNNLPDEGPTSPLADCQKFKDAEGRLASVTVQVMDGYAQALSALAENKTFDLGPEIKVTTGKLAALKTSTGESLVSAKESAAMSSILNLLLDIASQTKREDAIRTLVRQKPELEVNAKVLRSFFVDTLDSPSARKRSPYLTLVSYAKAKLDNTWATVTGPALRKIEPVRAKELELAQKPVKTLLLARDGAGPDKVAGKIAAAIDAWLVALEVFEKEALKPESRALLERLKDLREKAAAAKDAVSDEAS